MYFSRIMSRFLIGTLGGWVETGLYVPKGRNLAITPFKDQNTDNRNTHSDMEME